MVIILSGKTRCCRCDEVILSSADAIGFPAFIPAGHIYWRYSDSAFHRWCFEEWDKHQEFGELYSAFRAIYDSRPLDAEADVAEEWGKSAFQKLFEPGLNSRKD